MNESNVKESCTCDSKEQCKFIGYWLGTFICDGKIRDRVPRGPSPCEYRDILLLCKNSEVKRLVELSFERSEEEKIRESVKALNANADQRD